MGIDMAACVEGRAAAASIACQRLIAGSTLLAAMRHAQEAWHAFTLVALNRTSHLSLSQSPPTITSSILRNAVGDMSIVYRISQV